ncbi:PREDICTED: uncharacterized protein LOC106744622 [Dinoponera quadriceps]|uniref:Uncharacterized protein LOC106744622 n=1 Tax=Dinoponera quadriceps TaxID=609295 RepID=A0A6P3XAX3_DINQU|nr:PREDICTED: uncharacterized protein LOC106744622 [Dinoponera quadriceps]
MTVFSDTYTKNFSVHVFSSSLSLSSQFSVPSSQFFLVSLSSVFSSPGLSLVNSFSLVQASSSSSFVLVSLLIHLNCKEIKFFDLNKGLPNVCSVIGVNGPLQSLI